MYSHPLAMQTIHICDFMMRQNFLDCLRKIKENKKFIASYKSMKSTMIQYLNIDQTQNFRCLETFSQNSHVKSEICMFINFIKELHNKTKCKQHLQQMRCN